MTMPKHDPHVPQGHQPMQGLELLAKNAREIFFYPDLKVQKEVNDVIEWFASSIALEIAKMLAVQPIAPQLDCQGFPANTANAMLQKAAEHDPNGLHAHQPGAKLDAGKPRPSLAVLGFSRALLAVSDVATFGAAKYTDNGWVNVPNGHARYTDAMLRHLLREGNGEATDPETGLLHAAHAAWNALARLDLELRKSEGAVPRETPCPPFCVRNSRET